MNGQDPNKSLESKTLGTNEPKSIDTLEVENLFADESASVAVAIPGTENLTKETVGANNSFNQTGSINGFTNSNKIDDIGITPPNNDDNKKKKSKHKFLFVIFIIVLMIAVSFGVYYVLTISNAFVKITPKEVTVGVGQVLSDDINDYITSSKALDNCSINTKNVDINKVGEYDVVVTCGNNEYISKVLVADQSAPVLDLNIVFKTVNSEITTQDFVRSCSDISNCKTSFKDETKLKEYLATSGGPYTVSLYAEDDLLNKDEYETQLYVTSEDIFLFANFSSPDENLTEYTAKKSVSDIFAINKGLSFLNVARRDYIYTFENEEDYKNVVKNKDSVITFDNISGKAYYDDSTLSFTISTDLSLDTLKEENNGAFPLTYQEIQAIYKDQKGYTPLFVKGYHQVESEE